MSRSCSLSGQRHSVAVPTLVCQPLPHQLWSLRIQSSAKDLSSLFLFVAVTGHRGKFKVEGGNGNCSFPFWNSRSQVRLQIRPGVAMCHRLSCIQHSSQVLSKPGPSNVPAREKPEGGPTAGRDRDQCLLFYLASKHWEVLYLTLSHREPPNSSVTEESWQ